MPVCAPMGPLLLSALVFEAGSPTETRAHSLARLAGQSASPASELQVDTCCSAQFFIGAQGLMCALPTEPSPQFLKSKTFLSVNMMSQLENSTPDLTRWIIYKTQVL